MNKSSTSRRLCGAVLAPAALWAAAGCAGVDLTTIAGLFVESDNDATPTAAATHRVLAIEGAQTALAEALQSFATVDTGSDLSALGSYDAVLIDADAVDHSALREHEAIEAALAAGKLILIAEPKAEHNEVLVHALTGVSAVHDTVALGLDRVVDSDGREHWAIIHGGEPAADDADAQAAAYAAFVTAVEDYLRVEKAELATRVDPADLASAQTAPGAAQDNLANIPAGAEYKHILAYVPPTTINSSNFTLLSQFPFPKMLDTFTYLAIRGLLSRQPVSHSVKNHWYIYHNAPDGDGDFGGLDTYVIILHQQCIFSPGALTWQSATSLGLYQDSVEIINQPMTWDPAAAGTLVARTMDLNDTSPANVNQTTSQTRYNETSTTKTLSVGISKDGLSAGAETSITHTVGFSQTHDVSDWGVINGSEAGSGSSRWVFHQQLPADRYLSVGSPWSGRQPKPVPALSSGANYQDTITVWTTLGLTPDNPDSGAFRVAFRTSVTHALLAQTTANASLFGPLPWQLAGTLKSQQDWRVELGPAFFTRQA